MSPQTKNLNHYCSTIISNALQPLSDALQTASEMIKFEQSPYLTPSNVQFLNDLSVNYVNSITELLIKSDLAYIEKDYIVLKAFFNFNSSSCKDNELSHKTNVKCTPNYNNGINDLYNIKSVPWYLLNLYEFIHIEKKCDNKFYLVPNIYKTQDISIDVLTNLSILIKKINSGIASYEILS